MNRLDSPRMLRNLERRASVIQTILAALLLIIILLSLWAWWRYQQTPKIESIVVDNVQIVDGADLCPGQVLKISYNVQIEGLGVVSFDDSVIHDSQPLVFSEPRRLIVEGPVDLNMLDAWIIPSFSLDPQTQEVVEWKPGEYQRLIAISAPSSYSSRNTPPALLAAPFIIRPDCEE